MRTPAAWSSIYSTNLSSDFLRFMSDYEEPENQQPQLVYQLALPTTSSTSTPTTKVEFLFAVPTDREHIIRILDSMLQILRQQLIP